MKISKQVIASAKELIDLIGADDVQEVEIERKLFGRGRIRIVRASEQAPLCKHYPRHRRQHLHLLMSLRRRLKMP